MSFSFPTVDDEDDPFDVVAVDEPMEDAVHTPKQLAKIQSIWEDDHVLKIFDDNNKPRWKCLWCDTTGGGHNATKVLWHVAKVAGNEVSVCKAKQDRNYADRYREMVSSQSQKRSAKKRMVDDTELIVSNRQQKLAQQLLCAKPLPKKLRNTIIGAAAISETPSTVNTGVPSFIQTSLTNSRPDPRNDAVLTVAVADFVHGLGLPFSVVDDFLFHRMLVAARNVGTNYKPPNRQRIAGDLLELNFDQMMKKNAELLRKEADIFGLCFYGDGATVKRMPLLNILCSGTHQPTATLGIVDCSGHMSAGGKKDASYISDLFFPHIEKLDPDKLYTDLVLFDGASNVQKAGEIIGAIYPRVTCLAGAEHVISLFFSDVAKKSPTINMLIRFYRLIYGVFGSGTRHGPYAIFQQHCKAHNGGRAIGLIRAADTRMGGHFIAFIRLLRLKAAMNSCIISAEFKQLKIDRNIILTVVGSDGFWSFLFEVVRAVFPVLCLLRLADQRGAAMDKLYYCVRQTDKLLTQATPRLDELGIGCYVPYY